MIDDQQGTGVERYDRYMAERRRTLQANGRKTIIVDEAGDIALGRPEECRVSKLDLIRARQSGWESDGAFTMLSGEELKAAVREALSSTA